jgi:hypothetical protein
MEQITIADVTTAGIPFWNWTGYNAQWVEDGLSRDGVLAAVEHYLRDSDFESATVLERDEHLTVVVRSAYEFYGWRESQIIVTTRKGVKRLDNDTGDGVWTAAEVGTNAS